MSTPDYDQNAGDGAPEQRNDVRGAAAWSVDETLDGLEILVTGTTGFLGKVYASTLLRYHPDIEQLHLLVRPRAGRPAEDRFFENIIGSPAFQPIREIYGEAFDEFVHDKVDVVPGDITSEHFGLDSTAAAELSESLDLIVNCAGLTNFNPNLESALSINTLSQDIFLDFIRLADDRAKYLHVSTCFVAGNQDGRIDERLPGPTRYPRYDELGAEYHARREIDDCLSMIEHAKKLADDQERQSQFEAEARSRLRDKNLPTLGEHFEAELESVREKWLRDHLSDRGEKRAAHWGWPNIYTYTKSLGERILAETDDVDVCICRPAIIESAYEYPEPGWIEGVNTSGPLAYLIYRGHRFVPTRENLYLDIIPVDFASNSLVTITAALERGNHHPVYHIGSSDLNPADTKRLVELTQLGTRRVVDRDDDMSTLERLIVKNADSVPVAPETFERISAPQVRRTTEGLKGLLDKVPTSELGGLGDAVEKLKGAVDTARKTALTTEKFFGVFFPFIAENRFIFRSRNYVELVETLSEAERQRYGPQIVDLDWREYWIDVHIPALAERIYPKIDQRLQRQQREVYTYEDLRELFDAATRHFEDRVAMQHHHDGVVERYSYGELRLHAEHAATLLEELGVGEGVPVLLASENRPQWGMAYFGILEADGIAVPVDPESTVEELVNFVDSSRARVVIVSDQVADRIGDELREALRAADIPTAITTFDDLFDAALEADEPEPSTELIDVDRVGSPESDWEPRPALAEAPEDGQRLASLIYTSGTTGDPKGVMLSHENFTSLLSNMKAIFDVDRDDEFVSVLPLHHTFEFSSGFLLPISEGATITYLEELSGEQLLDATNQNRATALVGVPALWELLYRRIQDEIAQTHPAVRWILERLQDANSVLRDRFDLNIGPLVFGAIHEAFGGRLDYLVSGGAALPEEVLEGFYGLGFDMYEGYGLTEAAPVLTVNRPDGGVAPGTVGQPLPDVDIQIEDVDEDGVGEIVATGPNVMKGYLGREDDALEDDGRLRTGDLGTVDDDGNLRIVGREKEVIVTSTGKNVYPDELEDFYGSHEAIDELSIVGLPDDSGSERVACLVRPDVPDGASEQEVSEIRDDIRDWFRVQASRIADHKRVQVLRFWNGEFPRTATRKIQRTEVVEILERLLDQQREEARERAAASDDDQWAWLDVILARLADVPADEIHAETHLYDDLGFDSLMFVEAASILEEREITLTEDQLAELETNQDLRELVERQRGRAGVQRTPADENTALVPTRDDGVDEWPVPPVVADAGRELLHRAQTTIYDQLYDVEVYGRAHIPYHDPNVIVAANHCSHLDMGLAKYALGDFGRRLRALAAADYFFDSPARKTYFKNFTNLIPVDRAGSLEEALSEANHAIEAGETILLFPEGTRSTDGKIHEFQPGLGYLVDRHDVDVLPMYIDGTYEAFPKGQPVPSPLKRTLKVYIGEVLDAGELREETAEYSGREQFAAMSDRTRDAVTTLRDRAAGLRPDEDETLEPLFTQLTDEFEPGTANGTEISYYFTLGDVSDRKWSVIVDGEQCRIRQGKPEGGRADCVVKTSPAMFRKIVREGYVPSVDEFVSGDIKTNDPEALREFQHFFGLS